MQIRINFKIEVLRIWHAYVIVIGMTIPLQMEIQSSTSRHHCLWGQSLECSKFDMGCIGIPKIMAKMFSL